MQTVLLYAKLERWQRVGEEKSEDTLGMSRVRKLARKWKYSPENEARFLRVLNTLIKQL